MIHFTIFTSHQTHRHWIMIYAILNLLFFCSRCLDWSAWSNPKFIYVSLFFSSPEMIHTTKPAHPSMTSRLLKKTTYRSFLFAPTLIFVWKLNCFQNVGTKDFGNHFWIAGNVVRDSQTVMHTKFLQKKSAMVYCSTWGDRKFHCIIGNHRYDFSQEIPSHIYCFVTKLGLTQSLP